MKISISKNGRKHIGYVARISEIDKDLAKLNWSCAKTGATSRTFYVTLRTSKKTESLFGIGVGKIVYLHRVILARKLNIPYSELTAIADHKNGDGLDNRRSNVRAASQAQNQQNQATGPYKGVKRQKSGRFQACVRANGTFYYLGTFDTAEEAKAARDEKAKQIHGRFFRP